MRNRAGRFLVSFAAMSPLLPAAPALAAGRDGEVHGPPMSLATGIGLFAGIPLGLAALIYFLVYIPGTKSSSSTDIAKD